MGFLDTIKHNLSPLDLIVPGGTLGRNLITGGARGVLAPARKAPATILTSTPPLMASDPRLEQVVHEHTSELKRQMDEAETKEKAYTEAASSKGLAAADEELNRAGFVGFQPLNAAIEKARRDKRVSVEELSLILGALTVALISVYRYAHGEFGRIFTRVKVVEKVISGHSMMLRLLPVLSRRIDEIHNYLDTSGLLLGDDFVSSLENGSIPLFKGRRLGLYETLFSIVWSKALRPMKEKTDEKGGLLSFVLGSGEPVHFATDLVENGSARQARDGDIGYIIFDAEMMRLRAGSLKKGETIPSGAVVLYETPWNQAPDSAAFAKVFGFLGMSSWANRWWSSIAPLFSENLAHFVGAPGPGVDQGVI